MRQQQRGGAQLHPDRIGQQPAAAATLEAGTQQKVAIAQHHMAGNPCGVFAQRCADCRTRGLIVVIADPVLEQVAQDVQRIGLECLTAQKADELRHGLR